MTGQKTRAAELAAAHARHAYATRVSGDAWSRRYHEREVIAWANWLIRAAELAT